MKLLPGTTLGARLREGGVIPADEALAILRQMAAGVAAIHAAGIVHRDIKSNNVMIDGQGRELRLWITDFGLARTKDLEVTASGREGIAGTPAYMAPELFAGAAPSQATDLFAFGVLMHEVFTGKKPTAALDGSPMLVHSRLSASGLPAYCVQLVKGCLDADPKRRCQAFEEALVLLNLEHRMETLWTRRRFAATAAAAVCALAGGAWWKHDEVENLLHPLPRKRFVALLSWPKTSDAQVAPMLTGVLNAIKGELARVEAYDRDLFVISPDEVETDLRNAVYLKQICDPLGANLALAASGATVASHFQLRLRLLNPSTGQTLREKKITCALTDAIALPHKAVQASALLLNLERYLHANERTEPETQSAAAFTAFQTAETLRGQPNDSGLEGSIERYKEAVDLDPHYAIAHARLAIAYNHLYGNRHDAGVLDLARANAQVALTLDPGLVDSHLAQAFVLQQTGDEQGALKEIAQALALDASNPTTLISQADIYTRLNRWKDAEDTFHRLLAERPNFWVIYNQLGYTLDRQGKYKEAIRAFRDATVAAPKSSMAYGNLGGEYLQVGEFANATESLRKSMALAPNDLAAANLSLSLRYQGKYEEALSFALQAVELNPSEPANWLELGDCYSGLHNRQNDARNAYLRAADETERHLQTDASNGPNWMALALYQVKSGSVEGAPSLIRKAESLGAGDLESQLFKARILEVTGKRDLALATLAACFGKGATDLQVAQFPDMQSIRRDSRYRQILQLNSAPTPTNQQPDHRAL
jgi:tetratricopeptide (TPR) repeat protein